MEGWRLLALRQGDEAIADALTRDDFGDPEDRGGVSGTQVVALCAIMEVGITGESGRPG